MPFAIRLLAALFIATAIASCLPAPAPLHSWPGDAWETAAPEDEGIDPDTLAAIHADLAAGVYGSVDHFLLIRHGRVVADHRYERTYTLSPTAADTVDHPYNYEHPNWHPYYQGTDLHTLQSVTKSVTSAALGIAIDEGLIEGVGAHVMPYLDARDPDLSDPRRVAMTLEDLLTMRSGIDWNSEGGYNNPEHSTIVMELSDDWIGYILSRPMREEPGTVFEYNDGASVLIGKVLTEATGMRADRWTAERLFAPIGIQEHYWKITPDGEADTEGGLYLKTHDLARIGYLFLRGGTWNGRQIVSREWVQQSTSPIIPDLAPDDPTLDMGYGFQWWVPGQSDGVTEVFAGNGFGGQFVFVAPAYDIVAVFNGWDFDGQRSTWSILQERILPATRQ